MTKKQLVSIIIPCYNVENYIDICIESVLKQDYENWECIVINDGSTDKTAEKLNNYVAKDSRIRFYSQENLGLSVTRNKGIDYATGDFLYFLDSDDWLSENAIRYLIETYQDNDIITGITVCAGFSGNNFKKNSQLQHPTEGAITFENENFEILKRTMESGLSPVAQNRLYKKKFIQDNKLSFKPGILHEDELWFFETMLHARKVKFINHETYFYRIDNQDSITKNVGDRNLESYLQVMEEIIQKYSGTTQFCNISNWYGVYIKKIFLDFAIREKSKLSPRIILRLENALKNCIINLDKNSILTKNNDTYYRTIQILSLYSFNIIQKYFFRNPINSFRKIFFTIKINYLLK